MSDARPAAALRTVLGIVLVREAACRRFDRLAQRCSGRPEAGGILIGCYRGPHVDVRQWTEPGPSDERSMTRFVKRDPIHQGVAIAAWRASGRTDTYVGEWHSHPQGAPTPSPVDDQTWRRLAAVVRPKAIFVIVSPEGWRVYLLHSARPYERPVPLRLRERGRLGRTFGA